MSVEFLPSGDSGLTIQFGHHIDRALSRKIMALRTAVDDAAIAGVVETVPTYRSLLVHYDNLQTSQAALVGALDPLIREIGDHNHVAARRWVLPICFANAFAPDLDFVADAAGMKADAVKTVLTETEHFVYMLGFAPGMPYMGDLPPELNIPRRSSPVQGIAKGSVLVATGLTIIYPTENPSGWHVVGRCPVPVFDLARQDPALLSPGDCVRFEQVSVEEFEDIKGRCEEGSFQVEMEQI